MKALFATLAVVGLLMVCCGILFAFKDSADRCDPTYATYCE